MKQCELIPAVVREAKKKVDRFAKYNGQCKVCRLCGGERLNNSKRAWSTDEPECCLCIKFNLCLDVDNENGKMLITSNNQSVVCDGTEWS